jgi:hypothetical protein
MKVHIERNWATGDWCLYVFDHRGDRFFLGKPMELVMEERADYGAGMAFNAEPTLRVGHEYEEVFRALAVALAGAGFKVDGREKELETVLKAKDAHHGTWKGGAGVVLAPPEIGAIWEDLARQWRERLEMLKRLLKEVRAERCVALRAVAAGYDLSDKFIFDFDGWDRMDRIFAVRIERLKRLIEEAM